jgi:hypothetical protein
MTSRWTTATLVFSKILSSSQGALSFVPGSPCLPAGRGFHPASGVTHHIKIHFKVSSEMEYQAADKAFFSRLFKKGQMQGPRNPEE